MNLNHQPQFKAIQKLNLSIYTAECRSAVHTIQLFSCLKFPEMMWMQIENRVRLY